MFDIYIAHKYKYYKSALFSLLKHIVIRLLLSILIHFYYIGLLYKIYAANMYYTQQCTEIDCKGKRASTCRISSASNFILKVHYYLCIIHILCIVYPKAVYFKFVSRWRRFSRTWWCRVVQLNLIHPRMPLPTLPSRAHCIYIMMNGNWITIDNWVEGVHLVNLIYIQIIGT